MGTQLVRLGKARARVCIGGWGWCPSGVPSQPQGPSTRISFVPLQQLLGCLVPLSSQHRPTETHMHVHAHTQTPKHPCPPPHYRLEHGNAKSADSTCTYGWMTLTATVCCLPLCVSCARYTCATHPEPTGSSSSSKNRSQPGPKAAVSVLCRQREHRHTQIQIQTQTHRHADTQARCDGGAGVDTTEHNRHTVSHVQARLLQACAASWPRLRVPLSR